MHYSVTPITNASHAMSSTVCRVAPGLALAACLLGLSAAAADEPLTTETIKRLPLRAIGPCITPGRVGDIAIDPRNRSVWYVAIASGGLWKTTNRGTTWRPIFDDGGSYSI